MRSLRARLLVGIISGMTMLLVISGFAIYTVTRRSLVSQFDASLAATARILAAAVECDDDKFELELDIQKMPEFQSAEHPAYYQFWREDGTVIARSASLGADDLLHFEGSLDTLVLQALNLRNDRPGRAVALKFRPEVQDRNDKQQPLILVVARDAGDLYYNLKFLRWLLATVSVGTITISFFVAAFVVRQGLHPLNSIAAEIAAIREDNLAARIATRHIPAEMVPIKDRLNDLLSRLEMSFKRERRFTADVAHELRTPLAGMRSTLEVALTKHRDVSEYQASLSDCLAIAQNMQKMMDNLLTLTRVDANQMTFSRERIQLADLVNSCWKPFSGRALERSITFENRLPDEMTCESDPETLSMVFSNLLDNAVEYTNEGGQIWLTGSQNQNCVEITIANTGCRLTSEQVSQVFDCFWRGDSARTDTGVHCGLGLALVQKLVGALGGRTIVEIHDGEIFTLRLALPLKMGHLCNSHPSLTPDT